MCSNLLIPACSRLFNQFFNLLWHQNFNFIQPGNTSRNRWQLGFLWLLLSVLNSMALNDGTLFDSCRSFVTNVSNRKHSKVPSFWLPDLLNKYILAYCLTSSNCYIRKSRAGLLCKIRRYRIDIKRWFKPVHSELFTYLSITLL